MPRHPSCHPTRSKPRSRPKTAQQGDGRHGLQETLAERPDHAGCRRGHRRDGAAQHHQRLGRADVPQPGRRRRRDLRRAAAVRGPDRHDPGHEGDGPRRPGRHGDRRHEPVRAQLVWLHPDEPHRVRHDPVPHRPRGRGGPAPDRLPGVPVRAHAGGSEGGLTVRRQRRIERAGGHPAGSLRVSGAASAIQLAAQRPAREPGVVDVHVVLVRVGHDVGEDRRVARHAVREPPVLERVESRVGRRGRRLEGEERDDDRAVRTGDRLVDVTPVRRTGVLEVLDDEADLAGVDVDPDRGLGAAVGIGRRDLLGPDESGGDRHRAIASRHGAGRGESDDERKHDEPGQALAHGASSLRGFRALPRSSRYGGRWMSGFPSGCVRHRQPRLARLPCPAMAQPQTGIFALGTSSHAYLELNLADGADPAATVARVASLREPRTTIGGVNLVAGFRPELWARVAPGAAPAGVSGFNEPVVGRGGYTAPATQHDMVIWLTGSGYDVIFDLSRSVANGLAGSARVVNEIVGWPYHHDLDLTGFIDGTENPTLVEATTVALIPPGAPGEAASVLLLQQWEHDASAWESLSEAEQEAVIGRRKRDSEELDPRPMDSHVAKTDQEAFGKIFRRNIAYGSLTNHGTIFVGFSAEQKILVAMLESMVGRGGPPDALTRFTRPISGAYYVIPSADALAALGADERA